MNAKTLSFPWRVTVVKWPGEKEFVVEERAINELGYEMLFFHRLPDFDSVIDYLEFNWPVGTKVRWMPSETTS